MIDETDSGPSPSPPTGSTTARDFTLHEVADQLGAHYMTVYRYVRTGRLPAHKSGPQWHVRPEDLAAFVSAGSEPASRPRRGDRSQARRRVEHRLLAADEGGAWQILQGALASGADPVELHTELLIPSLQSIGQRWADGEISILEEHRATAVATRLVARLGPLFKSPGRSRGIAAIGAVAGDGHALTSAIVADLLRVAGFEVIDLGANTPPESFAEVARDVDGVRLVGVSASSPGSHDNARLAIAAIRDVAPDVVILVGGNAIADAATATDMGADGYARSPQEILATVEALLGG